jgi:serine/threonine protein kinase
MVTPEGVAKVLDFGLAKALPVEAAPAQATGSYEPTREGAILGTPSYMSPEQVRGKPLDRRTDIWSFGCVLYEALTARRAFAGETLSDTLAVVLEREPDWSALPLAAPAAVRVLLQRWLRKDLERRPRDIGDIRVELLELISTEADGVAARDAGTQTMPWALGAGTLQSRPLAGNGGSAIKHGSLFTTQGNETQESVLIRQAAFLNRVKKLERLHSQLRRGVNARLIRLVEALLVLLTCGLALPLVLLLEWLQPSPGSKHIARSLEEAVKRTTEDFPEEVKRWGGPGVLRDREALQALVSILQQK